MLLGYLTSPGFLFKKKKTHCLRKQFKGDLYTKQDEPAGLTDDTNGLFSFSHLPLL